VRKNENRTILKKLYLKINGRHKFIDLEIPSRTPFKQFHIQIHHNETSEAKISFKNEKMKTL
jgi:hypothetical protein